MALRSASGVACMLTVQQRFTGLVEDAHVHGAGVEIDATVKGVLFGVESHEVSSLFVTRVFPTLSIPRWSAGEGASISINRVQPTPYSVRCAPASGSG